MKFFRQVIAIETSCDDTSVAMVRDNGFVVSCLSANQDLVHQPFGGVVPEIASRNHTLQLLPLIDELFRRTKISWDDIDGIAVTSRPGLIGSLLVGVVTAKTLALAKLKPFIGINHLEAHLMAPFLHDDQYQPPKDFTYPYIALAVSGGHTQTYLVKDFGQYQVLGKTVDDAAGEAFDKFAKLLGFGFPGGVKVDHESKNGKKDAFHFPRGMIDSKNFDFSFSGTKAAATRLLAKMTEQEKIDHRADLCASYQESIVDALMFKLKLVQAHCNISKVVLTGGVSANSRLREQAEQWAKNKGITLVVPPLRYCTDNAAMVGLAGLERLRRGQVHNQELGPSATSWPDDFIGASL